MKYSGAKIVIECLAEQGVDLVFGYPGGTILNIYDELYKNSDRIRHILTAHEQGASHAADGYARTTGKVGVVLATSGPGCTNLVTGIATAYMDSVPMVAITCNVPTHLLGKDSFQEVDITGITLSITKHNYIVRDVADLAATVREAFDIARSGRPGPVLIDIPKDITAALAEWTPLPVLPTGVHSAAVSRSSIKIPVASEAEISRTADLLAKAERPFFYVGGGVVISDACDELKILAEKLNAPVSVSLMGKSAFPSAHPLCTGMIGMHGTKASNTAANNCDLLIAIGARFSDRVISDPSRFAQSSQIVQIDIDPAEINKNVQTAACLNGNIKEIIASLNRYVPDRPKDSWNDKIDEWKKHVPSMYTRKTKLHPKYVLELVHEKVGDDAIITTEVGQHQMWVAQFYPFTKPRTFLTSGGLGTMGYGTGAAIGAQTAWPDKYVVHIAGDGSFRMNLNELSTISYYKLPIIIIVANNGTLGMVRQWQKMFYNERYSQTTLDRPPDFVKLADAFGVRGFRATTEAEFAEVFNAALSERTPALIDCYMDIDEMVFPMVPPGKPIDELMLDAQS
ncbi:MAG TPA: biosynthetic-type acetolactate synthase large subunit [Treponemataceae bacterium]|nr:biosynthetic-type acetolactate synthase large subunit [Treponemataceae bacterium]